MKTVSGGVCAAKGFTATGLHCGVPIFNDTATTEIYTLALHDALPISPQSGKPSASGSAAPSGEPSGARAPPNAASRA